MNAGWKSDESELLNQLALRYKGKNWKMVASELNSHGFNRTQTQCRYKWVNYVDPEISNQPWSEQELQKLFKGYQAHRSQWSLIQQSLPGRTQIRIRNQFYGTLRNILRFSIKYFKMGNGKWSFISNQVKPQILQNLYDGIQEFEFSGGLIKGCIKEMGYKYEKEKFLKLLVRDQEMFKEVVKKINNEEFFINNRIKKVSNEHQRPDVVDQLRPTNSLLLNSAPDRNQPRPVDENRHFSLQPTQMMINPMIGQMMNMPSIPNVPQNQNFFYTSSQNQQYQPFQFNQSFMFQMPNESPNIVYLRPYHFLNSSNI